MCNVRFAERLFRVYCMENISVFSTFLLFCSSAELRECERVKFTSTAACCGPGIWLVVDIIWLSGSYTCVFMYVCICRAELKEAARGTSANYKNERMLCSFFLSLSYWNIKSVLSADVSKH